MGFGPRDSYYEIHLESRMLQSENQAIAIQRPVRANDRSSLLSAQAMELVLLKERMRCDRHALHFSMIVLNVGAISSRRLLRLARVLDRRLRLTDERGWLAMGGIGVMLPMTNTSGAQVVLSDLVREIKAIGMQVDAVLYSYDGVDRGTFHPIDDEPRRNDDESVSARSFAHDGVVDLGSTDSSHDTLDRGARPIRADRFTQGAVRSSHLRDQQGFMIAEVSYRFPIWKRAIDIVGASVGLILASPILLTSAMAIKLTSRGPIFFRQMRTGQFGRPFAIYKLRTMVVDAEELKAKIRQLNERDGPAFKIKNDPRVTFVGSILRKSGFDELPQLWNVLIGNMSIVGPRPLPCDEDAQCEVWHRRRLDTKPGLTCDWQVSKSRAISFRDWMRMDLRYADQRSFLGDMRLMVKTVSAVVLGRVGH